MFLKQPSFWKPFCVDRYVIHILWICQTSTRVSGCLIIVENKNQTRRSFLSVLVSQVTKEDEFFSLSHCQLLELISQDSIKVLCESEVCDSKKRTLNCLIFLMFQFLMRTSVKKSVFKTRLDQIQEH